MRILVTGGAGFIGSHLVDRLLHDHTVAVVDDFSGGSVENLPAEVKVYEADCRNFKAMDRVMEEFQPEVIYHLAANAAENKAQFSPVDITSRNYDAFIKTLTAGIRHGVKRFVFTSSIAVYGHGQTPFKESDKPEPEDLYGISKLAAEQTLKVMSKVHGFEYVIVRPHNVFGPRQNMRDPYRNVVTIFMNKLLRHEFIPLYGNGDMTRQFTYVKDLIPQLFACLNCVPGMTYNVGSGSPVTVANLATAIQEASGERNAGIENLPARPQEVKEAIADHSLASRDLTYSFLNTDTPLSVALRETWQWCKEQGPQEPLYTELEIESPLKPSNW